tara:strand:- start:113 stop:586 length:474 start_codon:yes stop_codon:yes gene_type:complete
MFLRRRAPRALKRDGDRTTILLGEEERALLVDLAEQFRSVLAADNDPDLRRLYPAAYADDAERDADYASLVHDDLLGTHLDAVDGLIGSAAAGSINDEDLAAWMQVLNGLRLLLGTRLDVSEEDEFEPEAADAPTRALLAWLGLVLEEAVESAAAGL